MKTENDTVLTPSQIKFLKFVKVHHTHDIGVYEYNVVSNVLADMEYRGYTFLAERKPVLNEIRETYLNEFKQKKEYYKDGYYKKSPKRTRILNSLRNRYLESYKTKIK